MAFALSSSLHISRVCSLYSPNCNSASPPTFLQKSFTEYGPCLHFLQSFRSSFAYNSNFKHQRRTRARFSLERSILEPGKTPGTRSPVGNTEKVSSTEIQVPCSGSPVQDSSSPLVSALQASAKQDAASFHFPGHNRGRAAPPSLVQLIGTKPFIHDLPELPELDNLFSPEGPILEAQKQAAKLFGSSETWFLVGGTTCGIQAAIMATCSPGDSLILPRNSHISAISAMVLSGALPKYIIPEYSSEWDIAGGITPSQVDKAIKELETDGRKAKAVLVTSPTYHGICSNLSEIAQLCHFLGIPAIVDEAHGAHFEFHPSLPNSALQQGVDLAVQSTHKVLCSLTQSSMLHRSGDIVDRERICRCLQTLQSTSPSYLLLASLDAATAQLSENPRTIFNEVMELAAEAKHVIKRIPGVSVLGFPSFSNFPAIDPLRITISVRDLGLSGYEADEILCRHHGVIAELAGTRSLTFAITLGTSRQHIQRLVSGVEDLSATSLRNYAREELKKHSDCAPFADISMSLSPREAFFASKRRVSIKESLGKVCGELICPYPPGIPVVFPGEVITARALDYLLGVRNKGAVISGASDPLLSSMLVCNV
ncbi:arginine decarboxylase-like [Telopea speciosissima]|uniref:arginine decarboxylase-like n=1 Tax=Telopea speciosissima TaxID=54955 RepID=UPI001CC769AF|nr:arginine decarboxylase-like [Telopea speciosissima]